MCLDDALTDLRPDEGGMPEKAVPTDHCPVERAVLIAARKDLFPGTVVDT